MPLRRKRSISVPPEIDAQIQAEAEREGVTYSAWLSSVAHKELTVRAGLQAVAEAERELGALTDEELAEAQAWAQATIEHSGNRAHKRRAA